MGRSSPRHLSMLQVSTRPPTRQSSIHQMDIFQTQYMILVSALQLSQETMLRVTRESQLPTH